MPILSNPRHERFAQGLSKGKSASESYVDAGYTKSSSAAARLCGNVRVAERVAEIQSKAAAKAEFTLQDMLAQVDEDRAMAASWKQAGAIVAASALKAKLLGMDKLKLEHTGKDGGPIETAEVRAIDVIETRLATVAGRLKPDDKHTEH